MNKLIWAVMLVGCGSSANVPDAAQVHDAPRPIDAPHAVDAGPDAPPDPLACVGQPAPTTAPDPLPITGKLFAIDHYNVTPIDGATVVVHRRADDTVIAQLQTDATGAFSTTVASGGHALAAYFTVDIAGNVQSYVDPGDPLVGGEDALLVTATSDEIARWYGDAGTTSSGTTLISVAVDCDHKVLGGTTISAAPAPTGITYYDDAAQKWNSALAASSNGYALVAGPATSSTITVHAGTTQFPAHAVAAPTGTLAVAVISPHS